MKEIDYKQAVEALVEHLNFIKIGTKNKRPVGDFIFKHKEYIDPDENPTMDSIFYHQDFSTKTVTTSLRRKYIVPKETLRKDLQIPDNVKNAYFRVVYDDILRWATLGKTVNNIKDVRGNTIQAYSFRDLIEGNYELPDNH